MTYQEQLLDKKWKSKRNAVVVDSRWKCFNCENQKIIQRSARGQIKRIRLKGSEETQIHATPYLLKFEILITLEDLTEHNILLNTHGTLSQENYSNYKLYYEIVDKDGKMRIVINAINEVWRDGFIKWKHVRGLHVHHKYYQEKLLPWEYPLNALTTLCWICHKELHENQKIIRLDENGNEKGMLTRCFRCHGTGYFPQYDHVEGGICFRCNGARYEELIVKPSS